MLYSYLFYLFLLSAIVFLLERLFAWRRQKILRPFFWQDVFLLIFNGEVFGFSLAWFELSILGWAGYHTIFENKALAMNDWALWIQVLCFVVIKDFIEYWIHRVLHSNAFLWKFHKTHHSVTTMDFWCNFRFHFAETIFYKHFGFLIPLLVGVDWKAVLIGACIVTFIGHLNHANLAWNYGPLKFIFNNPRMHYWHHEIRSDSRLVKNYGVVFSIWDFMFGTAYLNDKVDPDIGLDDHGYTEKHPLSILSWSVVCASCCIYFLAV